MKVVTILIPSFQGLRYERGAYKLGPTDEKKRLHFNFICSAQASSTNNFEHYFLQGSLVSNKKLMKKYCKLVFLLSILVWVTECKIWNWKWHSVFLITNPLTVKQIKLQELNVGDIHSFAFIFLYEWLYQYVQTHVIAYVLYDHNNFFNPKCENLICVYKSTVIRGNM